MKLISVAPLLYRGFGLAPC